MKLNWNITYEHDIPWLGKTNLTQNYKNEIEKLHLISIILPIRIQKM